jgi:hypothetical protein
MAAFSFNGSANSAIAGEKWREAAAALAAADNLY